MKRTLPTFYPPAVVGRQSGITAALAMSALALAATLTSAEAATPVASPAQQCLVDLRAFDTQQQKDGYWLDGGGYGYGYPVYGYGYSYGDRYSEANHYLRARPGYEVRTLLAAARILASSGQQVACESVLGTARDTYGAYVADLKTGRVPMANVSVWRQEQIAMAMPVTSANVVYRSDQLIGVSIVNAANDSLGSVEDLVLSPTTGRIAYLVVGHGGLWGMNLTYTPVPWAAFKSALTTNLLILAVPKATLAAAPSFDKDKVGRPGAFAAQSALVDAYWTAHLPATSK